MSFLVWNKCHKKKGLKTNVSIFCEGKLAIFIRTSCISLNFL